MAVYVGHDAVMTVQRDTDSQERADFVAALDKHRGFLRYLLHILAETAQHAGHADIVREALDGSKTMG
jgi:hypothetical protein